MKRKKVQWIGHVLRRNCLLQHIFQENVGGMVGRARRHKQLLNGRKEKSSYRKLEVETHRTVWRTGFERGCGLVAFDDDA